MRRDANGACLLPDLAWGAEAWLLVRLHHAPDGKSDPRQSKGLLAVVLEGESDEGGAVVVNHMLAMPLVPASDFAGMPQEELVARRLKEVEFAEATARIQALVGTGELRKAKGLLKVLEAEVADHPGSQRS